MPVTVAQTRSVSTHRAVTRVTVLPVSTTLDTTAPVCVHCTTTLYCPAVYIHSLRLKILLMKPSSYPESHQSRRKYDDWRSDFGRGQCMQRAINQTHCLKWSSPYLSLISPSRLRQSTLVTTPSVSESFVWSLSASVELRRQCLPTAWTGLVHIHRSALRHLRPARAAPLQVYCSLQLQRARRWRPWSNPLTGCWCEQPLVSAVSVQLVCFCDHWLELTADLSPRRRSDMALFCHDTVRPTLYSSNVTAFLHWRMSTFAAR